MASGIKDKVAVLGMGCSKFGERWDASPEDLMVEAYNEAMADAGIGPEQLDAAWFSTHMPDIGVGRAGMALAIALRLPNIVPRRDMVCRTRSVYLHVSLRISAPRARRPLPLRHAMSRGRAECQ